MAAVWAITAAAGLGLLKHAADNDAAMFKGPPTYPKTALGHEIDPTCSFEGLKEVTLRIPGAGIDDLAVAVEGVDTQGKEAQCLGATEANIISLNHLDPSNPPIELNGTFKVPKRTTNS